MTTANNPTLNPAPVDEDLAEQARPGFGIPSQDPRPQAQYPLSSEEAEREAQSALAGGGVMVGAAAGAGIGVAVGGPIGAFVGGALGGVAGALGAVAAGSAVHPEPSVPDEQVRLHLEDSGGNGRPVVLITAGRCRPRPGRRSGARWRRRATASWPTTAGVSADRTNPPPTTTTTCSPTTFSACWRTAGWKT